MNAQTSVCRDCGEMIWFDGTRWLRLMDNSAACIFRPHKPKGAKQ